MENKKRWIGNGIFFFALFGLTFYAIFRGKELPELLKVMRSVSPVYYILGFGL